MVLGLIKRLEEENQVNVYMANEKNTQGVWLTLLELILSGI